MTPYSAHSNADLKHVIREAGFLEKFGNWLITFNGIISLATGGIALEQQVARMIEP